MAGKVKETKARPPKAAKAQKPKKKRRGGAAGRIAFAILVTLAVLALGFFLVMRDQGRTSLAENAVGSVFAPVQNAVSAATKYVRDVVTGVKDYLVLQTAYEDAQQEIASLKLQLTALEEDASENERLTDLLDAQTRYQALDPVYARVIAREPGVWFDTFSINRGTRDGVRVNMSVVTGDGLVGRVIEAGLTYAKVMSIIDTRSAVACLIERTRDNGVMRGQVSQTSENTECNMYYLPAVNDIVPGDAVLTSGVDTLFPKGVAVGTVASVSRQSDMSDQYIVVLPGVDFLHIEEVLVLRTEVESATDSKLPALATPTPKPTPAPTPTPTPPPEGGATADDEENAYFVLPTPMPEGYVPPEEGAQTPTPAVSASPTPAPTYDPNVMQPEDRWAM